MAGRKGAVDRAAIMAAADLYRRPDGTFRRSDLVEFAAVNGVSERTVRRWSEKAREDGESPLPARADRPEDKVLLQALALHPHSRKSAWKWLRSQHGYPLSYRTFLRDLEQQHAGLVASAMHGTKGLVDNRLYTTIQVPQRNQQWHLDHTLPPLYVHHDRGDTHFRPWLSAVVDRGTGMVLALEAWEGHPNTETVIYTLVRAAVGDEGDIPGERREGGLPATIVFDNALEHLSGPVREGCLRLGIIGSPTTPYHSWENGAVERLHRTLEDDLLSTLPGFIKAGTGANHNPRFGPRGPDDPSPTALLSFSRLRQVLEEWRHRHNATCVGADGRTPLERWNADPTALMAMTPALMLANMTIEGRLRTVNKSGIRFRNEDYVSVAIASHRGKQFTIRYLPSVTDWIEVFDGSTHIGRAWRQDRLPAKERNALMLERARTEKRARAVDADARKHRSAMAQVHDDLFDDEDAPQAPTLHDALADRPTPRPALPPAGAPRDTRPTAIETTRAVNAISGLVDVSHLTVIADQEEEEKE